LTFARTALGSPEVHSTEEPPARAEAGCWAFTREKAGVHMSADYDALIRTTKQLLATRIALLHTMEALRREMEKSIDDSEARMVRTRQLLAGSAALLQQAKIPHQNGVPDRRAAQHPGGRCPPA
jgi:hypothetical protein